MKRPLRVGARLKKAVEAQKSGCRGASRLYSESAILCALSLQMVYRLPLRATVGLLSSLFELMGVELPVPDYSTLSRRRATLEVELGASWPAGPVHWVVDGSGFKVFGEGEWKVRQHGISKRRTWRKLHIGNDEQSGEIMAAVVTTTAWRDDEVFDLLLDQIPAEMDLKQVSGDGIYDSKGCYELLEERGVRAVIPPRRGARLADLDKKPHLAQRNANIQRIREWDEQGEDGRKNGKKKPTITDAA